MRIDLFIQDLPLGSEPIPHFVYPRVERVKARDAAHALAIPQQGAWGRRLRREMRARGWKAIIFRHHGESCSGYERVIVP